MKYYILAEEEQIYNFSTFCNNFTFILDWLQRKKASYNTIPSREEDAYRKPKASRQRTRSILSLFGPVCVSLRGGCVIVLLTCNVLEWIYMFRVLGMNCTIIFCWRCWKNLLLWWWRKRVFSLSLSRFYLIIPPSPPPHPNCLVPFGRQRSAPYSGSGWPPDRKLWKSGNIPPLFNRWRGSSFNSSFPLPRPENILYSKRSAKDIVVICWAWCFPKIVHRKYVLACKHGFYAT